MSYFLALHLNFHAAERVILLSNGKRDIKRTFLKFKLGQHYGDAKIPIIRFTYVTSDMYICSQIDSLVTWFLFILKIGYKQNRIGHCF